MALGAGSSRQVVAIEETTQQVESGGLQTDVSS